MSIVTGLTKDQKDKGWRVSVMKIQLKVVKVVQQQDLVLVNYQRVTVILDLGIRTENFERYQTEIK